MSRLKRILECLNEQTPLVGGGLGKIPKGKQQGRLTPSSPEALPLVDPPPGDDSVWPYNLEIDEDGNIVFPLEWQCQGPCAEIYCPDSPGGCIMDPTTGDLYTITGVDINGTNYQILVVTHPDGSQYAYVTGGPTAPNGQGTWFLVIDGDVTNISYNPLNGQYIAFIDGVWCYQGDDFSFPNGPWVGVDGNEYPAADTPLANPNDWMFDFHHGDSKGPDDAEGKTLYLSGESELFGDGQDSVGIGFSLPWPPNPQWTEHLAALDLMAHLYYLLYGVLPPWASQVEGYEPGDWYDPDGEQHEEEDAG